MRHRCGWFLIGLVARSDKTTSSVSPDLPRIVVNVLDVELDAAVDWNLSYIPSSGVIFVRSNLLGDF